MAFDYKKEYKEYYMPPKKPTIVDVPPMNYIAVRGKGNPNDESGEYKSAIGLLYGIAFTLKMSYKGSYKIDGYFSMSFRRSKDYGGRRGMKKLTIDTRKISNGSP